MNKQQTITINGVAYDAHTGMRIETTPQEKKPEKAVAKKTAEIPAKRPRSVSATAIHGNRTKKSATLSRRYVATPAHKKPTLVKKPMVSKHVKSPMISKFAKAAPVATAPTAPKPASAAHDIGPVPHPKVTHRPPAVIPKATKLRSTNIRHRAAPAAQKAPTTNTVTKQSAIEQALAKSKPNKKEVKNAKRGKRLMSIATGSLALVLLAGYVTYINMPSLSVRVAAMQSGVAATYPSYQPAGYSLRGPVAYEDGQVTMKFASNTSRQNFTLNQSRSTWDSSALLDNYVQQASNGQYQTYNDSGLTIYVYGTDAAWVNGGILHTISGDASLSNEQIRHLATSM